MPRDFDATSFQLAIMQDVFLNYPATIGLDRAAAVLAAHGTGLVTRAQAEVVLEQLVNVNALKHDGDGRYSLTKAGRHWAVNNLDVPA